jgi:hypothetical protein
MRQVTLPSQGSFEKYGRKSRREQFLESMEAIVPWSELERLIEPHCPKAGLGWIWHVTCAGRDDRAAIPPSAGSARVVRQNP